MPRTPNGHTYTINAGHHNPRYKGEVLYRCAPSGPGSLRMVGTVQRIDAGNYLAYLPNGLIVGNGYRRQADAVDALIRHTQP